MNSFIPISIKRMMPFARSARQFTCARTAGRGLSSSSSTTPPFHLAIPVHSIPLARDFYGGIMNLTEGRRCGDKWQDYSMGGHQLVCHYVGDSYRCIDYFNPVDGDEVPVPHFGLVLGKKDFIELADRFRRHNVQFIIDPHLRFAGMPGEQWTMFLKDFSGNNLEFKSMTIPQNLFARYDAGDLGAASVPSPSAGA